MIAVVSLGGSIAVPDAPDTAFLENFVSMAGEWLSENSARKLILVVGGGGPARTYQRAYKTAAGESYDAIEADWLGIMATRLNAQLLRALFRGYCLQDVVYDPTKVTDFSGRVMVAAGWKPGFSTDNDAVLLAERFAAKTVLNISNIEKVYTADPRTNPDARPIDEISWKDFRAMVGDDWAPGKNTPFDPVASQRAESANITVFCIGKDIDNIKRALGGKNFTGTKIF
ncbi:MAG: UMP kinase [Spirochaetaceae bacterium]|jgi:uridylate kinase|nr:UMP kinase [Spirochaetaceae bacterium]